MTEIRVGQNALYHNLKVDGMPPNVVSWCGPTSRKNDHRRAANDGCALPFNGAFGIQFLLANICKIGLVDLDTVRCAGASDFVYET